MTLYIKNFFINKKLKNIKMFFGEKIRDTKILVIFCIMIFSVGMGCIYLTAPKFLDYENKEGLINNILLENNDLKIKKLSNINYKIFPSPRLILSNVSFEMGDKIILTENSQIQIILKLSKIINFKKSSYNKIYINSKNFRFNISKSQKLLSLLKKNKKNIFFKKGNIIFFINKKNILTINNADFNLKPESKKNKLSIKGFVLNEIISLSLVNNIKGKNIFLAKIPGIDSKIKFSFNEKKELKKLEGNINLEILNNYLQLNFLKDKKYNLKNSFFRGNYLNTFIEGNIILNPTLLFNLNLKISMVNLDKILPLIINLNKIDEKDNFKFIKKLNGIINFNHPKNFLGRINFQNGLIKIENVSINKKNRDIKFDLTFGKNYDYKKIEFNLMYVFKHKKKAENKILIKGNLIPSTNKIQILKIQYDDKKLDDKKIDYYEKTLNKKYIKEDLKKIFDFRLLEKFLKSF